MHIIMWKRTYCLIRCDNEWIFFTAAKTSRAFSEWHGWKIIVGTSRRRPCYVFKEKILKISNYQNTLKAHVITNKKHMKILFHPYHKLFSFIFYRGKSVFVLITNNGKTSNTLIGSSYILSYWRVKWYLIVHQKRKCPIHPWPGNVCFTTTGGKTVVAPFINNKKT